MPLLTPNAVECTDQHVQLANREQFLATLSAYFANTAAQLVHFRGSDDDTSSWGVKLVVDGMEVFGWISEIRYASMNIIEVMLAYQPEDPNALMDEKSLVRVHIGTGEDFQHLLDSECDTSR